MLDWWALPGPNSYVDEVARDLVAGTSVALAVPDFFPDGFRAALRRLIPASDGIPFETVYLSPLAGASPTAQLHSVFLPDETGFPEVRSLIAHPRLSSRVIWLEGIDEADWSQWRAFLEEFQQVAHSLDNPPALCVVLPGTLATAPLAVHTPRMRRRAWSNRVRLIDMQLYVAERLPTGPTRLHYDIGVSVIANLALWDPVVADVLIDAGFDALLDPAPVLTGLAESRNWSHAAPSEWRFGTLQPLQGTPKKHSAWLAVRGERTELARRVWRGQVGVLFPFIEECRQDLILSLKPYLAMPIERLGKNGVPVRIDDPTRLEVADISRQLKRFNNCDEIRRMARCLTTIRNRLAHFADENQPLSSEFINSPELADWRGIIDRFEERLAESQPLRSSACA